jgi:EAL domain-containing protein (putative c-di-GMP-specific phosphodiesterase class I)
MVEVGEWVLNAACEKLSDWRQQHAALRMAVNVAGPQFDSGAIASVVSAALERFSLPPESLELEVTEGLLMRDMQGARTCLADLKRIGVRVSVDDFGTGYSSLACLSRFPVDALKIDRSFVAQATACKKSATVTSAIVGMGHRLGLSVVAEGVENAAQVEFLRTEGCDLAQGFLLGRPLADWPASAGIARGA